MIQILNRVTASYKLFETLSRLHATGTWTLILLKIERLFDLATKPYLDILLPQMLYF